ncbi:MAG: sigma-70 family RNA polymerase sigma factor [Actinobacteria bacterium]|nr:sigma-70 family RNA polymerase sigma factor [Actinomycetota bacterium]
MRAQLARRFAGLPDEEIEDAVQTACRRFLDKAEGITDPLAVYAWLHTTAHRLLLDELGRRDRIVASDPSAPVIDAAVADEPGPIEELITLEDESDLAVLAQEVTSGLTGRRREVFALWVAGYKRAEIAEELAIKERAVKRTLEGIMREARTVLAKRVGGGCNEGESLVLRLVCGLAETGESLRARAHLDGCRRCSAFADELEDWRQRAGVVLGPAAAEVASPGVVGRTLGRTGEAISSAKRHILEGGTQAKQTAATSFVRTTDPTPFAGIKPGAVAAVVAGCLAVGTGAATYCVQHGVDPLSAATGLIAGSEEGADDEPQPAKEPEPHAEPAGTPTETTAAPTYEPAEEAPVAEGSPAEDREQQRSSASEIESRHTAEPALEEVTPPPEQSFEPASPDYPATETQASESSSSESSSSSGSEPSTSEASKPTPVPANEAPQFGGP